MTNRIFGVAALAGALFFAALPSSGFAAGLFENLKINETQTFALSVPKATTTSDLSKINSAEKLAKKKIADAKRIVDQEAKRLEAYNQMMKAFDGLGNSAVEMQRKRLQERADKAAAELAKLQGTLSTDSGKAATYHALIAKYAAHNGVPLKLAHAVVRVESNYRATARGQAGEIGLMQIKPATARGLGYTGSAKGLYDPETNIKYGMMYLGKAHSLANGSTCGTILRYNAGHGATKMNPVSSRYCKKVQRYI